MVPRGRGSRRSVGLGGMARRAGSRGSGMRPLPTARKRVAVERAWCAGRRRRGVCEPRRGGGGLAVGEAHGSRPAERFPPREGLRKGSPLLGVEAHGGVFYRPVGA